MSPTEDRKLNKAALVIAKLLIRTREGKIHWKEDNLPRQALHDFEKESSHREFESRYTAELEDSIQVILTRDDKQLGFRLSGPPASNVPAEPLAGILGVGSQESHNSSEILSISLGHAYGKQERFTPESIIYRDLEELIQLARDPKSVSNDLRLKQVMSYLDKLAV
jgi:hypothetical protein